MSYDLMVFRKEAAPRTRKKIMEWFDQQTEWEEQERYDNPALTSNELRNWYLDIIKDFPDMNGPYAIDDISIPEATDYTIAKDLIYVAFAWSMAEKAYHTVVALAEKHGVGFFDVSEDRGDILVPGENGKLTHLYRREDQRKPWWKFW